MTTWLDIRIGTLLSYKGHVMGCLQTILFHFMPLHRVVVREQKRGGNHQDHYPQSFLLTAMPCTNTLPLFHPSQGHEHFFPIISPPSYYQIFSPHPHLFQLLFKEVTVLGQNGKETEKEILKPSLPCSFFFTDKGPNCLLLSLGQGEAFHKESMHQNWNEQIVSRFSHPPSPWPSLIDFVSSLECYYT